MRREIHTYNELVCTPRPIRTLQSDLWLAHACTYMPPCMYAKTHRGVAEPGGGGGGAAGELEAGAVLL